MNIFEKIENITKQGYSIEYQSVNQLENGYMKDVENGLKPLITYTVYVVRLSDSEYLYVESYDHIEDCLKAGIEYVEKNLINI